MKVKICGVCRAADARVAEDAGADYVGVILALGRARTQTVEQASRILADVTRARRVGVFLDQPVSWVLAAAERLALDVVQLHGAEPAGDLEWLRGQSGPQLWKAVPIGTARDLEEAVAAYGRVADGLLLDGARGGAGVTFEWRHAQRARDMVPSQLALIVAGGLNPENVGEVKQLLLPDVVDVATGVEGAPGEKSAERIRQFIRNARA